MSSRVSRSLVVLLVLAAAAGGVVAGVLLERPHGSPSGGPSRTPDTAPKSSSTSSPASLLRVSSVSPASGATDVSANAEITVAFSSPLAANSPLPSLDPPVAGNWRRSGAAATFTPSVPLLPLSTVEVVVPGGASGVRSASGAQLAQNDVVSFRVANGSILRIQQLLSLLDYSPLVWSPSGTPIAAGDTAAQTTAMFEPPAGTFSWRNRGWPVQLRRLWRPDEDSVFTRGLIMSFQADHGLTPNGHIGPALWSDLISSLASRTLNRGGYNFALTDKHAPESFTVWHDGRIVLRSSANTGIAGSPTPDGTYPVFTRLRSQVMRGTNPGGTKYADLVQYVAYFNGNDAVHYMPRADYGIPQSLGCVELPLNDAADAWPYLAYGTLVTVIG